MVADEEDVEVSLDHAYVFEAVERRGRNYSIYIAQGLELLHTRSTDRWHCK